MAKTLAPCEIRRWTMATPTSPVAPVTMMFFPENSMGVLLFEFEMDVASSDAARCGARDHPEPAKINVAGDEIGRCLQKCLKMLRQHVGVKTFRRTKPSSFTLTDHPRLSATQPLAGYGPCAIPEMLGPEQAKLSKAGSDLVFQLHHTTNGQPGCDRSRIGLVLMHEPKARVLILAAANIRFVIPPGDPDIA
jgi:hypothetical protein